MIEAYNLGSQVPNEDFIKKALELHADVLLVSQTVTQKDVHIQNLTNLIELLEAEGLRDKFVVCCGGPRITHELAKELGFDAGFGAGKYADDVASFAVTEMVKRGHEIRHPMDGEGCRAPLLPLRPPRKPPARRKSSSRSTWFLSK